MNYELLMEEQIKHLKDKKSLLLHVCCAPCSSAVIEFLQDFFDITLFFYNPNITDLDEYQKRLAELKRFVKEIPYSKEIPIIEGRYQPGEFFAIAKGLEKVEERGVRCFKCYRLRLEETAQVASANNFDYFTTTLTLSPYKNATWINTIGEELNKKYSSLYLYSDFKKKERYKRSIVLSEKYHLYRQDYCGCIYSKK